MRYERKQGIVESNDPIKEKELPWVGPEPMTALQSALHYMILIATQSMLTRKPYVGAPKHDFPHFYTAIFPQIQATRQACFTCQLRFRVN